MLLFIPCLIPDGQAGTVSFPMIADIYDLARQAWTIDISDGTIYIWQFSGFWYDVLLKAYWSWLLCLTADKFPYSCLLLPLFLLLYRVLTIKLDLGIYRALFGMISIHQQLNSYWYWHTIHLNQQTRSPHWQMTIPHYLMYFVVIDTVHGCYTWAGLIKMYFNWNLPWGEHVYVYIVGLWCVAK